MVETGKIDLYLAGAEYEINRSLKELPNSNVLFSYEFSKKLNFNDLYKGKFPKIFVDSGAYSMWTRGIKVDVDSYIEWLQSREEYLDLFGQIDIIPGAPNRPATDKEVSQAAADSWNNYLYMRDKLKYPDKLLYTFHVGEPVEFLIKALEYRDSKGKAIPYIALGGMVGKNMDTRRNFLSMCFDIIKNSSNPNVKVHAFGMTSKQLLMEFPITSADSTSWIMTAANGGILTDSGAIIVSEKQKNLPNHYSHLPSEVLAEFENRVCVFGFSLEELSTDRNARVIHNARFMENMISQIKYIPVKKIKRLF